MIKLLALDLDGTLLDSKGKVPEANRRAICDAEEAGRVVMCSSSPRSYIV